MVKTKGSYNLTEIVAQTVSSSPDLRQSPVEEGYDNTLNNSCNSKKNSSVKYAAFLGLFYTCLNVICNGFLSVLVKKVPYISTSQLSLIQNAGVFLFVLPLIIYFNRECLGRKEDRFLLLVRGIFSATGYYTATIAYRYMPLAEAAIIISAQPIVTTVIARLYLKEACDMVLVISLVLTVLGVLLSVRLPEVLQNRNDIQINFSYLGGMAAAIATVLLRSISSVFIRKLKHIHFSIPLLYAGFAGIVENSVISAAAYTFVSSYCGWDQILCMLMALFGFMVSAFSCLAVMKQPAGIYSVEKASLDVIIFPIFQILFFYEYPDNYVISGGLLVMVSLGMIGLKTWLHTMPEESLARRKLKYLLY